MGDLTKNFDRVEFACKCGCGFDEIKQHHVEMLQQVRDEVGFPMPIASGCRCLSHNTAIGGVPDSSHMRGEASDVTCLDSERRFKLARAALKVGFTRIGIGKTFVHMDRDPFLPQPRLWLY